jgi:hypothetical protein
MFDIVDEKNNIKLKDFIRYSNSEINQILKINEKAEIELHDNEQLNYIKIYNFFENPEEVKKFLVKFPCEDRMMSLLESNNTDIVSQAPGFQQTYNSMFFKNVSQYFHNLLKKNSLCHYEWDTSCWEFYTNCIYSGMKCYNQNYLPHLDEFSHAANIYLTNIENTGTNFFKFRGIEGEYYNLHQLSRNKNEREYYKSIILKKFPDKSNVSDWVDFEGNDQFIKYHTIPAEYNSVSLYKGNFWHSIKFDASVKDQIRYSLVAVLI